MLSPMTTRRAQPGGTPLATRLTEGEEQWLRDLATAREAAEFSGDGFSTVVLAMEASHVVSVGPGAEERRRALLAYGLSGKATLSPEHPREWAATAVPRHYGLVYVATDHSLLATARALVYTGGYVAIRGYRTNAHARRTAEALGLRAESGIDSMAVFAVRW